MLIYLLLLKLKKIISHLIKKFFNLALYVSNINNLYKIYADINLVKIAGYPISKTP
jgi:hypothetical protein